MIVYHLSSISVGGGADFVLWIDYLIHIQNSIGDTRIGLVFSEDEVLTIWCPNLSFSKVRTLG